MKLFSNKRRPDYTLTLQKGISFVRGLRGGITDETGSWEENIRRLKEEIRTADAIVIGAGAGLSTAAGFTYSGERFDRYFFDFKERFGIRDMYSGGFYPYPSKEVFWAYWARYIYVNRYLDPPKPTYEQLLSLVKGKDYFAITTNVDNCFQKAGIDIRTAQRLMGHADIRITANIYTHVRDEMLKGSTVNMGDVFRKREE